MDTGIVVFMLVGMLVTAGSVFGIVALAKAMRDFQSAGKVFAVLGMLVLSLFALAGSLATVVGAGCTASKLL